MTHAGARLISRYLTTIHWFIPTEAQRNAGQLSRAQNVVNAVVMAALSGPLYALTYYLLGYTVAAQEILACCAFMFVAPFLLRATRSIALAREVFLCAVFFNFTWLTYHLGGVNAPTAGWMLTAPVVAMFLGGCRSALCWLGLSCLAAVAIYVCPLLGLPLPAHPIKDMGLLYVLCDVGLYLVIVLFVLLFELTKTDGFSRLEHAIDVIREVSIRDELTGTHNRRHLVALVEQERERVLRGQPAFCVCLLDIDFFKRINDTWGHAAGDAVLRTFAAAVQQRIRDIDAFGRYGGEEFLLMLPCTSLDDAMRFAERVRRHVETLAFPEASPRLRVSVSIGVAQFRAGQSIDDAIGHADAALYLAKSRGRNRVVRHDPSSVVLRHPAGKDGPSDAAGAPARTTWPRPPAPGRWRRRAASARPCRGKRRVRSVGQPGPAARLARQAAWNR